MKAGRPSPLRSLAVFAGTFTSLQLEPHRSLERCQFWRRLIQGSYSTCPSSNDETRCLVYPVECHVNKEEDSRKLETPNGRAANDSEPSLKRRATRLIAAFVCLDWVEISTPRNRLLREEDAAGSNPVSPTTSKVSTQLTSTPLRKGRFDCLRRRIGADSKATQRSLTTCLDTTCLVVNGWLSQKPNLSSGLAFPDLLRGVNVDA